MQILDLVPLAPDIPERMLALEAVDGVEPLSGRALREVLRCKNWVEQRTVWGRRDIGKIAAMYRQEKVYKDILAVCLQ